MQNRTIEIHDSTLDAVSVRDGQAILHFPSVYIHHSVGTPGVVTTIPLAHKGIVELRLQSWNDEVLLITGSSAELELIGEPKYVEEVRADKNGGRVKSR